MDTKFVKSLLIILGLSVGTHDRINRISIEHFSTVPMVVQLSQLFGLHKVFWLVEWESTDWYWIKYFVFFVHDLSLIKSWPIKILPAFFSLKATQWITSPALIPSTEVIGSQSLHGMSLKWYLGKLQQAGCQVTCRWPSTKKSTWKLMGHWYLESQIT